MKTLLLVAHLVGQASTVSSGPTVVGAARFSVLTDSLVRMEWDPDKHFVDAPSLIFENSGSMPPFTNFTSTRGGGGVVITTPRLRLDFHPGANDTQFTAANLEVSFELNATTRAQWAAGDSDSENLNGTLCSMDCYEDPAACQAKVRSSIGSGLISRSGWALIDDTDTARWTGRSSASSTSAWKWWTPAPSPPGSQVTCKLPPAKAAPKPWKVLKDTDWTANNCLDPYSPAAGIEECADLCAARCDCVAVSAYHSYGAGSACNFKCNSSGSFANAKLDAVIVRPGAITPPGSTSLAGGGSGRGQRTDHYLFAHGHRYTDALSDFALVAGKMDMPPLSAFGIWWSRYWVYSVRVPEVAQDIVSDVLEGYRDHALPLNHLVMDMDWHSQTSQYSWNQTIIKDPGADTTHGCSCVQAHPALLRCTLARHSEYESTRAYLSSILYMRTLHAMPSILNLQASDIGDSCLDGGAALGPEHPRPPP